VIKIESITDVSQNVGHQRRLKHFQTEIGA